MNIFDISTIVLVTLGAFFFIAGTIGLVRFPDLLTRLHALTKIDNLGLGLVTVGLLFQSPSAFFSFQLLLIWLIVMASSVVACSLLAENSILDKNGTGTKL